MSSDSTRRPSNDLVPKKNEEANLVERRVRQGRHPSAMVTRPSLCARLLGRLIFGSIRIERRFIDDIKDLAQTATVVYVMQTRSLLDYLYFNFAFLAHELPLARFANGVRTTVFRPIFSLLRTLLQRRYPSKPEVLERTVATEQSALLFLGRSRDRVWDRHRHSQELLKRLVDLSSRPGIRRIVLVPLLLVWEKRSEHYRKTVFDEVFGTTQSPGRIRKLFYLIKSIWQSLLRAGSPTVKVSSGLDLSVFVRNHDLLPRRDKALLLDEQLVDVFERERRVIVGPPLKSASLIRREVVRSERVDSAIQAITRSKPEYPSVVKKQAKKIIKEIAADYNLLTIKFLSAIANPIFDTLYQGFEIDLEGLNAVRDTARTRRLVIVPSHKSHLDYLIISNVFYQHGLMPPHIAAGANLSFWPMGPLFRRAGAFFLRRSFRGDDLYTAIFTEYLRKILNEGFSVEFFIEGTRSRTGKLMRPRYGLLGMIVQAALDGDLDRVAFVPVSVGYERIVEARSYQREVQGGEKSAENLSGVIKATRVLRAKYGRVYVEFSRPLLLDELIRERELEADRPDQEIARGVRRLAYRILSGINEVTTVTPSAVVAAALLASREREVEQSDLLAQTGFIVNYLIQRRTRLSNSIHWALVNRGLAKPRSGEPGSDRTTVLAVEDLPLESYQRNAAIGLALEEVTVEAVQLLASAGSLKVRSSRGRTTYLRTDEHRLELSYYRNNIIHYFGSDAIVATLLAALPGSTVRNRVLFERATRLAKLLKYEFCFTPRSEAMQTLDRTLSSFVENRWLRALDTEGVFEKVVPEPRSLVFFRQLLAPWLEGYLVAARTLHELIEEPVSEKDLVKSCLKTGRRLFQEGRITLYESLSKPSFKNAIESFKNRKIIAYVVDERGRASDSMLELTESYRSRAPIESVASELEALLVSPLAPSEPAPNAEVVRETTAESEQAPNKAEKDKAEQSVGT